MLKVFVSYSHRDRETLAALETHLSLLRRQGIIETWTDCAIAAGDEIDPAIREALDTADIVLLLVSADFLASDYCIEVELRRAIERHEAGTARVIPIIVRDCEWHSASFGKLKALPEDGHPVSTSGDRDAALVQVARAIRNIASRPERPAAGSAPARTTPERVAGATARKTVTPVRTTVPKAFTDRDRDSFLEEAFEHIANVFEASLNALEAENERCRARFKRRSESEFTATIYMDGATAAECKVWYEIGGLTGRGIAFSYDPASHGSYNEHMRVEEAEGALRLKAMGMALHGRASDIFHPQGAAEYYWGMLVDRLRWAS